MGLNFILILRFKIILFNLSWNINLFKANNNKNKLKWINNKIINKKNNKINKHIKSYLVIN